MHLLPPPLAALTFSRMPSTDLAPAYAIEKAGYPADEAASREQLEMRNREAPDYFWAAYADGQLVGFVCGTLSGADKLTDESMSKHEADGTTLCIHSVVVTEALRRRKLATWMLQQYLLAVREHGGAKRAVLLCKEHLVCLYEGAGFTLVGKSDVVHGADPWMEMQLDLTA